MQPLMEKFIICGVSLVNKKKSLLNQELLQNSLLCLLSEAILKIEVLFNWHLQGFDLSIITKITNRNTF